MSRKIKVVVIGDGAVGKTSIVRRFVEGKFDDDYIATIGVNVRDKRAWGLDLSLWDIYGQKSISPGKQSSHYIGAVAALVVFDMTRSKTFEHLDQWIEELYEVTGKIPVVVAGNKIDIIRDFEDSEGIRFSDASKKDFQEYIMDSQYHKTVYSSDSEFLPVKYSEYKRWGKEKKRSLGDKISYHFTSAKSRKNVKKVFRDLSKKIKKTEISFD